MAKVLSLTQPWASLVAFGEKKVETRSWTTEHRGILLIHASKGFPKWAQELVRGDTMFLNALLRHGVTRASDLPLGKILCETRLADVIPTSRCTMDRTRLGAYLMSEQEEHFGDYGPKRYGLLLENTRMLRQPIPASGALGLWEFDDVWSDV